MLQVQPCSGFLLNMQGFSLDAARGLGPRRLTPAFPCKANAGPAALNSADTITLDTAVASTQKTWSQKLDKAGWDEHLAHATVKSRATPFGSIHLRTRLPECGAFLLHAYGTDCLHL